MQGANLRFRWQNYRGYEDTGWLQLRPLTLLVGGNNAGKTSLYSPLLLLKQTLDFARPSTALLSQGDLFDAGHYRDFVRDHNIASNVTFAFELDAFPTFSYTASLESDESPRSLEVTFSAADERGLRTQLERYRLLNAQGHALLRRQRRPDGSFGVDSALLPSEQAVGRPPGPVSRLREAMRAERPSHFLFSGSGGLIGVRDLNTTKPEHLDRVRLWLNAGIRHFQVQNAVNASAHRQLNRISYVGPLRALPQRTYRLSVEPPADVGTDGRYAPELLYRDQVEGSGELVAAINLFLDDCDYGNISFRTGADDESFEVLIGSKFGGPSANLADSGMGLSQLLPLITQSLAARPASLSVVQQPEIHLNPALQVRFMDHLAKRLAEGQTVIIETHSEHLLLRLRRLIAEGAVDAGQVSLLFADRADVSAHVRPVTIRRNGSIPKEEWPQGFFAEQLQDSLMLARAQARRPRA